MMTTTTMILMMLMMKMTTTVTMMNLMVFGDMDNNNSMEFDRLGGTSPEKDCWW